MELNGIIEEAKKQFKDILADRILSSDILLEEVEALENDEWRFTFSFFEESRPDTISKLMAPMFQSNMIKTYKVLYVDKNGKFKKIENYD